MWRRLLGISLLVVLVGCNKYRPDPLEGELSYLVGIWDWDSTFHSYNWCSGGATIEETIYPEGYENSFTVIFSSEGYISFYANDSIIEIQGLTLDYSGINPENDQHVIFMKQQGGKIAIVGSTDQCRITEFPFLPSDGGCEEYKNYFSKR